MNNVYIIREELMFIIISHDLYISLKKMYDLCMASIHRCQFYAGKLKYYLLRKIVNRFYLNFVNDDFVTYCDVL